MAANHVLEEVSGKVFRPGRFAKSLLQPVFREWISYL